MELAWSFFLMQDFSLSALAYCKGLTHSKEQCWWRAGFLSHCLPSILNWHPPWLMTVLECAVLSRKEAHTDLGASWGPASVHPGGWCHTAVSDGQSEQAVFPPDWLFDLESAERKQQKLTVLHWQRFEENKAPSHI